MNSNLKYRHFSWAFLCFLSLALTTPNLHAQKGKAKGQFKSSAVRTNGSANKTHYRPNSSNRGQTHRNGHPHSNGRSYSNVNRNSGLSIGPYGVGYRGSGLSIRVGGVYSSRNYGLSTYYNYFPSYGSPGLFQSYYRPSYNYGSYSYPYNSSYYGATNSSSPYGYYDSTYLNPRLNQPLTSETQRLRRSQDYLDILESQDRISRLKAANANSFSGLFVSTQHDAVQFQAQAESAFRNGDYREAAKHVKHALVEDPENGKLQLFAAHVALGLEDYTAVHQHLDSATNLLHQNDWDYVIRNRDQIYSTTNYHADLNKLVDYCSRNPNSAVAMAVRGFHYGCLGMIDSSRMDLSTSLTLDPNQQLAGRMLTALKQPVNRTIYLTPSNNSGSQIAPGPATNQPVDPNFNQPANVVPGTLELPSPRNNNLEPVEGIIVDPRIEGARSVLETSGN